MSFQDEEQLLGYDSMSSADDADQDDEHDSRNTNSTYGSTNKSGMPLQTGAMGGSSYDRRSSVSPGARVMAAIASPGSPGSINSAGSRTTSPRVNNAFMAAVVGFLPDLPPLFRSPAPTYSRSMLDASPATLLQHQTPDLHGVDPSTPFLEVVKGTDEESCLHRMFRSGSMRGAVFNLCSATLGAGALSLPYAFRNAGLAMGVILLVVGALATVFSIELLLRGRRITGKNSYEELTVFLFGKNMGLFVELNIIVFCFGVMTAYIVAVGDILQPIVQMHLLAHWMDKKLLMIAFWLVVMLPLSLLDKMNSLRFSSFFGVLSIFYLLFACVYHSAKTETSVGYHNVHMFNLSFQDVFVALPVIMFAFTCQINVFSIQTELERPNKRRMNKVVYRAIGLCFFVYTVMGAAGYADFAQKTKPNILNSYDFANHRNPVIGGAFAAITLTVVMAFPLNTFPCRYTIEYMIHAKNRKPGDGEWDNSSVSRLEHFALTLLICGSSLVVALYVPNISVVFQLMGGTSSAFVCFVLPAAFAIKLQCWTNSLEWAGIWMLCVGGVLVGVASTAVTIMSIV